MKSGDIIFVRGHNPVSYLIRLFDKGRFSHVCVAVSPTHIIESEYNTRVRITELNYKDIEIVSLNLSDRQRDFIVHKAIELVGRKYDYLQILGYIFSPSTHWGSPKSFICSELVYELLKEIGINIHDRFIKPNELYEMLKNLQIVNKVI